MVIVVSLVIFMKFIKFYFLIKSLKVISRIAYRNKKQERKRAKEREGGR
jgi:hypothetical protein